MKRPPGLPRDPDHSKAQTKIQRRPPAKSFPVMCYIKCLGRRAFKIVSRGGLEWIESCALARLSWLLHAFSTRRGGVSGAPAAGLNLGFTQGDRRTKVQENRRLFFRQLGAERFSLAAVRQTHSAVIYQIVQGPAGKFEYRPAGYPSPCRGPNRLPPGDALMTNQAGILLSVRSADCLPVLVADLRKRAVAIVHMGWRGALQRIVEKTVGEMRRVFGSHPSDLRAALGPSIRACCYEVGEDVVAAFRGRFANGEKFFRAAASTRSPRTLARRYPPLFLSSQPPGRHPRAVPAMHLDLVAAACAQLRSAGLRLSNIRVADFCTACRTDRFFSHRKEGSQTGRMMAVIGIRPGARDRGFGRRSDWGLGDRD